MSMLIVADDLSGAADCAIGFTNAGRRSVVSLDLDGPNTRTIDASRAFFFYVGGTIQIGADQAEGLYESNFDVTADYQ